MKQLQELLHTYALESLRKRDIMKIIKKMVDRIDDEIESAQNYAEKYLELKAADDPDSSKYKDMANDEIRHATFIHDIAVKKIDLLRNVYTPPFNMEKKWEESHKLYVERVAWIKQMLQM